MVQVTFWTCTLSSEGKVEMDNWSPEGRVEMDNWSPIMTSVPLKGLNYPVNCVNPFPFELRLSQQISLVCLEHAKESC